MKQSHELSAVVVARPARTSDARVGAGSEQGVER